jgi:putative tryptophan/tyrosine transport system substrate-binding protein
MRRREFMALLGGTVTWPFAASAQEAGRTYRIAFLGPTARDEPPYSALFDELQQSGFVEGQNMDVDASGFGVSKEQLAVRVASIVKAAPDVIFCGPAFTIRALQQATRTIPLVGLSEDFLAEGLVASLAKPDGNATGVSLLSIDLDSKRQELLISAVPATRKIAAMADSNTSTPQHLRALQDAARTRGVELSVFAIAKPTEIVPAVESAKAAGAGALNFLATPLFSAGVNRRIVFEAVADSRLPAMHQWPEMAEEGGFAAYGPRLVLIRRQQGRIAVKILRGAKPADIPVEQPDKFDLVINLKTAKTLGLTVSPTLLALADKVIE